MSNLSWLVASAWDEVVRESPDPFVMDPLFNEALGLPRMTYRDRLTRPRFNMRGEVIRQIVLVRANLRLLGRPVRVPRLP